MALAELLDIAGIIGLHHPVVQIGDLPGSAALIVLDGTHDPDLIAHGQDVQTGAVKAVAVVNVDAVIQAAFRVLGFHIDALGAGIGNDHTGECHLHAAVVGNVGTQLPESQFHGIAVVVIGIRLSGVQVLLKVLAFRNGSHTGFAVAVLGRTVGTGQTLLQQLHIQIFIALILGGPVPYPDQIPVTGGVRVPGSGFRFDHNGSSCGQLFPGVVGGGLAVFLDLAGGFRGVDRQEPGLQHIVCHDGFGNMEMDRVAVHKILDGDLLLRSLGVHVQNQGCRNIFKYTCGGFHRRFLPGRGSGFAPTGRKENTGKKKENKKFSDGFHFLSLRTRTQQQRRRKRRRSERPHCHRSEPGTWSAERQPGHGLRRNR